MHYDFVRDLADGHAGEDDVVQRLLSRVPSARYLGSNHNSAGDIIMEMWGQEYLIEVKTDIMSSKTGNIAIEYESRGKPSDIAVSKAPIWIFKYCGNRMRAVFLSRLKQAYTEGFHRVIGGDKGSRTKMFLVPVRVFETWGITL